MAKTKSSFYCTECGHETSGWLGRCPGCGSWNTMQEALKPAAQDKKGRRGNWAEADDKQNLPIGRRIVTMNEIESKTTLRQPSQLSELDRVLGGGFVQGSLVLIGGDPGIGKSTLLLQVAGKWQTDGSVLYISGEESLQQIRMRSDRLGIDTSAIKLLAATDFTSLSQRYPKPDRSWL
jgi:DNA repair protein RadA/Sms